jgi:carboxylesterase type B
MPPRNPNLPPEGGNEEIGGASAPSDKIETPEELRARIKKLEAMLETSIAAQGIAEDESARLSAQAQSTMFTTNVTERFAGKDEDGQDLWWYRIDLAPCGGTEVKINGMPYYHGQTYKFGTDLLRSIKEIVSRTWDHENNIMGNNENIFKQAQNRVLRGGDSARR